MSLSELMAQPASRRRRAGGFTLIELMICVAVVGVLSSISYPAFSSTMTSTRRGDALLALMKVQLLQERFRSEHPSYGELSQLGLGSTSPSRVAAGYFQATLPEASTIWVTPPSIRKERPVGLSAAPSVRLARSRQRRVRII
jgi:type IV pilus assembly protein PilE